MLAMVVEEVSVADVEPFPEWLRTPVDGFTADDLDRLSAPFPVGVELDLTGL